MWGLFLTSSMKAANTFGSETQKIWRYPRIWRYWKSFSISPRNWYQRIHIRNVNYMDTTSPSWTRSTLLSDRALKWTRAKVYVYSDSVLCLGKIHDPVEAVEQWKGQVTTFRMENSSSEPSGLHGEPIVFEWKILPGFTALQILHKIQSDLEGSTHRPTKVQW